MVERRRAHLPGVDILFGSAEPSEEVVEDVRSSGVPVGSAPQERAAPRPTPLREAAPTDARAEVIAELSRFATAAAPFPEGIVGSSPEADRLGTLLSFLVVVAAAGHVIELGAPTPSSSLWLAGAMGTSEVLTTISPDADAQARASQAFRDAGLPAHVRTITGEPEEVLPRLSDGGYDLVVAHGRTAGSRQLRDHAARLLRPGGVLLLADVTDGAQEAVEARRALVRELIDDPRFRVSVVPVGGGVALAAIG